MKRRVLRHYHDIVQLVNVLALVYYEQGEIDKAEQNVFRMLKVKTRSFGPMHAEALQAMTEMAIFYENQNLFAQAEPLYEEIWKQKKICLGMNHRDSPTAMYNLGSLLCITSLNLRFIRNAILS